MIKHSRQNSMEEFKMYIKVKPGYRDNEESLIGLNRIYIKENFTVSSSRNSCNVK